MERRGFAVLFQALMMSRTRLVEAFFSEVWSSSGLLSFDLDVSRSCLATVTFDLETASATVAEGPRRSIRFGSRWVKKVRTSSCLYRKFSYFVLKELASVPVGWCFVCRKNKSWAFWAFFIRVSNSISITTCAVALVSNAGPILSNE